MRALLIVALSFWSMSASALPLEIQSKEGGSGTISLKMKFDGVTKTIRLDTGADQAQILKSDWNSNYPVIRQLEGQGAAGHKFSCDVVAVPSVSVGSFEQKDFHVTRCDQSINQEMIGLNFFFNNVLYFDFEAKKLELNDPKHQGVLPLKSYPSGHVGMEVGLNDHPYFAVFDTGAEFTSVDQAFIDKNPASFDYLQAITTEDASGSRITVKVYAMKGLTIKGIKLADQYALAFDFGPLRSYFQEDTPIILGVNIMTQYNWTIDLKQGLWDITPMACEKSIFGCVSRWWPF